MGCDIHWYSETKHYHTHERTDFEWICDQASSFRHVDYSLKPGGDDLRPEMDEFAGSYRDYWFFGLLYNGVRTDWTFAFPGKCLQTSALKCRLFTTAGVRAHTAKTG